MLLKELPGFTGFQDGLWVADSNLFEPTYSRRLLFGIAASVGKPLMVVPALIHDAEIPGALAYSLVGGGGSMRLIWF